MDQVLWAEMDQYILQKLDQIGSNAAGYFVGCKYFTLQLLADESHPSSWNPALPDRIRHLVKYVTLICLEIPPLTVIRHGAVEMVPRDPNFTSAVVKPPFHGQKMADWFQEIFPVIAYGENGFVGEEAICQRLIRFCPNTVWHPNIPIVVKQYLEWVILTAGASKIHY